MSSPTHSRRFACALLALIATLSVQGFWLAGLDRDAALTIATARA
jgi:hypothetical protein